jgi:hypothetical protein
MSDIYTHAMEKYEERYPDFISLFDGKNFYTKVRDEIALTGITKPPTIDSIIRDTEQAVLRLLDRGALNSIQKFGTTNEAEDQIKQLQKRAGKPPETIVRNTEAPSRWSDLTQEQLDAMPARRSRELYKSDAGFRAAFDRLAEADAAKAPSLDTTGRVYLRRKSDQQFFKEWKNGTDYWTPDFGLRAHMTYPEGHRQIANFRNRSIEAEAFEMGTNQPVDVAPKQTAAPRTEKTVSDWKLQPSGLTTVGSNQRRHRPGTFLLKSENGEFVGLIDDSNFIVKTVSQSGNARAWTSRETAIAAAESIPGLNFWLYRHDGEAA